MPNLPKLWILDGCSVAARGAEHIQIGLTALLDTGNDITIVNPEKVAELEARLGGIKLPIIQQYYHGWPPRREPAYDLIFTFPDRAARQTPAPGHSYSSDHGVIAPSGWSFDVADVWVGQDILMQLVCTFDGIGEVLTIGEP